jgi:hypothetical protein
LGYYMRFIVADERPTGLDDIRTAFVAAGVEYEVDGEDNEATIAYQGEAIGQVTLNVPGDGLFDDERDELVEFAQDLTSGLPKRRCSRTNPATLSSERLH